MKKMILIFAFFLLSTPFYVHVNAAPGVKEPRESQPKTPADYVDPHMGTGEMRSRWFYFNTATRPFGMVNLSADTDVSEGFHSGHSHNTDTVKGFSHLHAWQLAGVSIMPTMGPFRGTQLVDYASKIDHSQEIAQPGYQQVKLLNTGIKAEFTSTMRVGMHRIHFPAPSFSRATAQLNFPSSNKKPMLVLNLTARLGPSKMRRAMIRRVSATKLEGYVVNAATKRRPKDFTVYFALESDQPLGRLQGWLGENEHRSVVFREHASYLSSQESSSHYDGSNAPESWQGEKLGVYLFPKITRTTRPLHLKVALSYVSTQGAWNNMSRELDHWDFDRVVAESKAEWNRWLGLIDVGTDNQAALLNSSINKSVSAASEQTTKVEADWLENAKTRFYTDLWHALQGRRTYNDIDGRYMDYTGAVPVVRQLPTSSDGKPLFSYYNSDSFWGSQFTIQTLWPLVYPKLTSSWANYLVEFYKNGGLIPRGPSGGNYTFVMTGAHAGAFLTSAYMKGIRNFDVHTAYEGMKKNAMPGGIRSKAGYEHHSNTFGGIHSYVERGYIPYNDPMYARPHPKIYHTKPSAQTLEYAYDDWALAQLAKELGYGEDHEYFSKRAQNYRNIFNPVTKMMHPRGVDGQFMPDYDPLDPQHWIEANGWQYGWHVPHDVGGLVKLMGKKTFIERLNFAFKQADKKSFMAGGTPGYGTAYVNYDNQPSYFMAHLFSHAGAPELTQKWVRRVKEKAFLGTKPHQGYGEDEDQGLGGALNVLFALGLFSVNGGAHADPYYELTAPIFPRIVIHLNPHYYSGGQLEIVCHNWKPEHVLIKKVRLNGRRIQGFRVPHKQLVGGGKLELWLK